MKPKYISENGYRRYGIEQYFEFAILSMLKETGSSLKEIKKHLHYMDGEEFVDFLEERNDVVKKEIHRLKQKNLMLKDMIICLRESIQFQYDILMIQHHEEELFEIMPTGSKPFESHEETVQRFINYNNYIINQEEIPRYPFGVILDLKNVRQDNYVETYYFYKKRREGMYAVMGHKGTDATHKKSLRDMIDKIESSGMNIKSDIYVYDMMNYIINNDGDIYAQKYCVYV